MVPLPAALCLQLHATVCTHLQAVKRCFRQQALGGMYIGLCCCSSLLAMHKRQHQQDYRQLNQMQRRGQQLDPFQQQ